MITIAPFKGLRPEVQVAKSVASRPYDVLNSKEAKVEAQGNPNSFLHITKSEIDLAADVTTRHGSSGAVNWPLVQLRCALPASGAEPQGER